MNVNLPRWTHASMAKFFSDLVATMPAPAPRYHVEGVDEEEALDFQRDSILFRMVGPYAYQGSSGHEWYKVEIQILCTDIVATTQDNAWTVFQWAGIVQDAMLGAMPVYRKGTGVEDDQSLVGCLEPDNTVTDAIRVVPYGQVDKESRVKQVAVLGRFRLCL